MHCTFLESTALLHHDPEQVDVDGKGVMFQKSTGNAAGIRYFKFTTEHDGNNSSI